MKVVICGAGQVGTTIARHLANEGADVTVVDNDAEQIRRVDANYDVRGIVGHASHPEVLRRAGARDADLLLAVTRSDEVNMVACQVGYSLFKIKRRVARLRHSGYLAQDKSGLFAAEHLPIDVIISPEVEIADGIARRLRSPGAFDMLPMGNGQVELLGLHIERAGCIVAGEKVGDIIAGFEGQAMTIVAIVRNAKCFVPDADETLQPGDDVYVLARQNAVFDVMLVFGHTERVGRRVVIVGAGNVGLHLARKLRATAPGIDVKIIEYDRDRAELVAQELGNGAIVLNGDALDRQLLAEAQTGLAETIVAVTNDDETNIFASVLAKQAGCKRAITLVNKRTYETLIPTLGIDSVVSPSAVTISTVLRHIRRGAIAALYALREDFGEVIEAEIVDGSRLLNKKLGKLNVPDGIKIGAVVRGADVIFPAEDFVFELGDHVIALITYNSLKAGEALFGAIGKRSR
ncbi:MAG: Trk system potassium transport protein TrkA [Pelagibacterium sp. SCN 63-23]|jgi:trk system potassium uptake protein TrkA|nr:MAG: Trk system potassium transport protein TrkA [Pelagibacterium sp. SCN 63-23]